MMHRTPVDSSPFRLVATLSASLLIACMSPRPVGATFHLNEITKVMVGMNGNNTIQAVELKMLTNGEYLVSGASIVVYDAAGNPVATLGTFSGPVPSGIAGKRILCATPNFATVFGITPDLEIEPGLLDGTGQVSFETPTCLVNAIAYGSVISPKNGTTSAPALTGAGSNVLVRNTNGDDGTTIFCPLSENASARFHIETATCASPVSFRNNLEELVSVCPTAAGVGEETTPVPAALRVSPNPFTAKTRIQAPSWEPLTVHDVQGRLVRVLTCLGACPAIAGPFRGEWDGTDQVGRRLPSGIYFLRYAGAPRAEMKRVVLLR